MWKQNAKGGPYCRGYAYPTQKRVAILVEYVNTQSVATTARRCKVSYNCVSNLVDLFQQKATLTAQTVGNTRPKSIPILVEIYIQAIVIIYPTLYVREIQQMVATDLNLAPNDVPSLSFISKLLSSLDITRKKCTKVAIERFSPYIQQMRQLFIQWRRTVDPRLLYFFDETGFSPETDHREMGRMESGFPLPSYDRKASERTTHSALGVVGYQEGVLMVVPIEGNFTADLVNDVISTQILPLLPRNSFLIADNASVHNDINLARILIQRNITLVKLPGYSYDLNPIEMVFGLAKANAQNTPGVLAMNMHIGVIDAFLAITTQQVRRFYRRAWHIYA